MLNDNAKKWVSALRGGKYEQGVRLLSNNGKFCCLGVACELALRSGIAIKKTVEIGTTNYGGWSAIMPTEAREWVGLKRSDGEFKGGRLTDLNDSGKTFSEIADIIESEPKGLFV